jgi:drug/metabolite transporter (DMT)-like permease
VYGDRLTPSFVAGGVLVIVGVVMTQQRPLERAHKNPR